MAESTTVKGIPIPINDAKIMPEEVRYYLQRIQHRYERMGKARHIPDASFKDMLAEVFKKEPRANEMYPYILAFLDMSMLRNQFACHSECFHMDFKSFYLCPSTSINEVIMLIDLARQYVRRVQDLDIFTKEVDAAQQKELNTRYAPKSVANAPVVYEAPVTTNAQYEEPKRDIQAESAKAAIESPFTAEASVQSSTPQATEVPRVSLRDVFKRTS